MSSVTLIVLICAVRVSRHSRPANLLHSGSLQLCSHNNWLLLLLPKVFFTHLCKMTNGRPVYNLHDRLKKKKSDQTEACGVWVQNKHWPKCTHKPWPFDFTSLISDARSLHDLLIQWVMDSFPLSSTKENTCLSRPNPGLRLSSRDSFGPLLISTMAAGQGQHRLDPKKPSKHIRTSQNLPSITSVWNGPLILGTLPPRF